MSRRIVIVGGGFSAATLAAHLLRRTPVALHISIIEPRAHLGRGLAYSAGDPDHRLNGPIEAHGLDPDRPDDLRRWCERTGVFERDPGCLSRGGRAFLRRGDLGAYLSHQVARLASDPRLGSRVRHVRDTAIAGRKAGDGYLVRTTAHGELAADLVVIATGNPAPALRPPFLPEHGRHPRIVGNPLEAGAVDRIPAEARVLVVGTGLTALDILSTLVRRGHRGGVLAISRRGLRPRGHPRDVTEAAADGGGSAPAAPDLTGPVPDFIARVPATARHWTAALRAQIRQQVADGRNWHAAFDAVRNVVWQIWPRLPLAEQQRFLRRLAPWYDVHRFRAPPMNDELVRRAERDGRVRFARARLVLVEARPDHPTVGVAWVAGPAGERVRADFDYVVNCTGLDHGAAWSANPFLRSLLDQAMLRMHPNGIGFDVGPRCEALDAAGRPQRRLRVVGPPTLGAFGDPLGVSFIVGQVRRILDDLLQAVESG